MVLLVNEIVNPEEKSPLDLAALLLVCLVLSVAVLFPENFISGLPFFATRKSYPLTLLLPFMAVGSAFYIAARRKYLKPGIVDGLVLLVFVYLLARNISGPENLATVKYFVYGAGLFYLTTILSARREALLSILVYVIVGLVMLTAAYGLLEYGLQKNLVYYHYIVQAVPDPRVGLHRIGSTLAHPVSYGAFLIQGLPFAFLLWSRSRAKALGAWLQALAMAGTLLALLALFFTYSKGSWIVGVLLALGLLVATRTSISRKMIVPALIIAGILAIMLAFFWQEVRVETEARAEESFVIRLETWQGALEGFSKHPLTGVGIKQGQEELQKYLDPDIYKGLSITLPVDNYYLNLLLEAGVIGLIIWLLFLVFIVLEGVKVARSRGPGQTWALAALISLLGLSLNSVTFESMLIWPNFVLFWISAGILHGLSGDMGAKRDSEKSWQETPVSDLL
ncbi:MAG: O-antigen ligase family protein [Thermoleophilia bacterium]